MRREFQIPNSSFQIRRLHHDLVHRSDPRHRQSAGRVLQRHLNRRAEGVRVRARTYDPDERHEARIQRGDAIGICACGMYIVGCGS